MINFFNHWMNGITWPVVTKKGSVVNVTMGNHGFFCDCKYFQIWNKCPHCETVAAKVCGEVEENPYS